MHYSAWTGGIMEDPNRKPEGTPYKQMNPKQKLKFILKLAICILTFGLAFPNVMGDRRDFMRGAALGVLAFTVGGAQVLLTPREARAQGVPFRLLQAREAET